VTGGYRYQNDTESATQSSTTAKLAASTTSPDSAFACLTYWIFETKYRGSSSLYCGTMAWLELPLLTDASVPRSDRIPMPASQCVVQSELTAI